MTHHGLHIVMTSTPYRGATFTQLKPHSRYLVSTSTQLRRVVHLLSEAHTVWRDGQCVGVIGGSVCGHVAKKASFPTEPPAQLDMCRWCQAYRTGGRA
jgi:hypothetical protein